MRTIKKIVKGIIVAFVALLVLLGAMSLINIILSIAYISQM